MGVTPDGGVGATTRTTRPTAASGGDRAGKSGPSAPSSTANTAPKSGGSRATRFNRVPAEERGARPSLTDAATRQRTAKESRARASDSTGGKSRPSTPVPASRDTRARAESDGPRSADAAERRLGGDSTRSRSGNDGRAERLNSGTHEGSRDTKIAELKERRQELVAERVEVRGRIDDLESEIERDEKKAGVVGAVVGAATAPVGLVAGIFGKENPVAQAAEGVAQRALGLEGDREQLEEQESELERQTAAIAAEIKRLEQERVLNFLADTAHVTAMDSEVAEFVEEGRLDVGPLRVDLRVAAATGTGSDGVFDSGNNAITVDSGTIEQARENMTELRRRGIVDADGRITDPQAFDRSSAGDDAIKTVSLIGVHEIHHAKQHASGNFEGAFEAKERVIRQAEAGIPATATRAEAAAIMSTAEAEGERIRTAMIEVESYTLQEQNDLRSGARKKAFITVDENGRPLPAEHRLVNVLAYQAGTPLVHGPTAGYVRASASEEDANATHDGHDHEHQGQASHDRVADGFRGPGFRGPGEIADGFRGPGFRGPGEIADGFRGPGFRGPGEIADGFRGPGFRGPGEIADGFRGPGFRGPGDIADGFRGPGFRGPGEIADGFRGPGHSAD